MKENLIKLIDNLQNQIIKNKTYVVNDDKIREYDQYIRNLKHIKTVAIADPRFPYKILQSIIDDLYRKSTVKPKKITIVIPIEQLINNKIFNPIVYGL